MIIIRGGKEYELTTEELIQAYYEQKDLFDRDNIRDNMEGYLEHYEYEALKNNEAFIEAAAVRLRQNLDGKDMGYGDALFDAFESEKALFTKKIVARVFEEDIDTTDRKAVETSVYCLLERAQGKEWRDLDVNSENYRKAMELVESLCYNTFPELYDVIFGAGDEILFRDGEKFDYNLFYFNPDSSAGGQILQCPFSKEQAQRMVDNEDYIDVLAENTQYLSDVNNVVFFDTVFELLDLKNDGKFLGTSVNEVCNGIVAPSKPAEEHKKSLSDKIQAATDRLSGSDLAVDNRGREKTPAR